MSIQEKFKTVCALKIFEPGYEKPWLTDPNKCDQIQNKLSYFNPNHSNSSEHIDQVYKALTRGVGLVEAGIEWENPAIGEKPRPRNKSSILDESNIVDENTTTGKEKSRRTDTDKYRGIQWKLVIVYVGFEIISKTLMMDKFNRTVPPGMYEQFLEKCALPDYKPIAAPEKKSLTKWLDKEDGALAEFLGIGAGDKKAIDRWLVESKPVDSWEQAYKLAKAMRNASAHGFLLPSRIGKWGLKHGFRKLTDDLALIVTEGLSKIT